jgi:hypothetical protein|tara:strand:- start:8 stop:490 length:483 start_codon:yes stop_codon:yes gene_type:complete
MKVELIAQPDNAKVWVYQSSLELTDSDLKQIKEVGDFFLGQWESHNLPVNGSIDVYNNRFIVISAFSDEDAMCGKAQDSQMRLIKELEEVVEGKLTDRMLVFYQEENELKSFHFSELGSLLSDNKITSETIVFNSLVATKQEFENSWKEALKNTWLNQFV